MKIRHAVIMAAGRGQRMMPLTDVVPKAMAPYRGTTLIAEGLDRIRRRIPQVHVTVGYKKAMLAQHVIEHGASTVVNTEGHGNAWWIYNSMLREIDEPVYVLTCDNVVELDFDLLEADYERAGAPPCMLVAVKPVEGLEGDFIFQEGGVVTALSRVVPADIYCSGIQILNPARINRAMDAVEDFNLLWAQLMKNKELIVSSVYPKAWIAVDTVQQLTHLNNAP